VNTLVEATTAAFHLLVSGDAELWRIIGISFRVSATAHAHRHAAGGADRHST